MPSMANITVKNKANADVVYVAKVPSAGDKTPAKWTQDALSNVQSFRPALAVGTKDNSTGKRRIVEVNFAYPIVQTVGGVDTLVDKVTFQGMFSLSKEIDTAANEEATIQVGNLMVSALLRGVFSDGFAPT